MMVSNFSTANSNLFVNKLSRKHSKILFLAIFLILPLFAVPTMMIGNSNSDNQVIVDTLDDSITMGEGNSGSIYEPDNFITDVPSNQEDNTVTSIQKDDTIYNIDDDQKHYNLENQQFKDNRDYRIDDRGSIRVYSYTESKVLNSPYSIFRLNNDQTEELVFQSSTEIHPDVLLEGGMYRVEVKETEIISSDPIILKNGWTKEFDAKFIELTISPYSFNNRNSIELEIVNDLDRTVWIGTIQNNEMKTLYVTGKEYVIKSPYSENFVNTVNTESDVSIPILIDKISIKPMAVVTFGDLVVNITTANNNPLSGVSVTLYNSTSGATVTSGNTDNRGFFTATLAPGAYDVRTYKASYSNYTSIWNSSLIIIGEQQTLLNLTYSQVLIYHPTSVAVYLYDNLTGTYITYQSTFSSTNQVNYYLPAGRNYKLVAGTTTYYVTTQKGMKHIFGAKINDKPYFYSVSTSGKTTANGNVNITIIASDDDFDYPLTFGFNVNFGSIIVGTPKWIAFNQWGVTVQYLAPNFNNVYQFNMSVSDGIETTTYRIYLSDRTSTMTFNSTGYNDRPLQSIVYAYSGVDGAYYTYIYTSTTTGVGTMNVPDGEYYFVWTEDNTFTSTSILINSTVGTYYSSHSWSEVTFFTKAEFNSPISVSIRVYNGTNSQTTQIASVSTGTDGIGRLILTPYSNYSFFASASTGIWNISNSFLAASTYNISFNFGAIVVYAFDNGTPLNIPVYYYANNSDALYLNYQYTGVDGITVFRLAPGNYAFQSSKTIPEWFYNVNITNNEAKVIGDFTNSNPIISAISASPARINAGENTTITVVMSDVDVVDSHIYTWVSNVGTIIGSGSSIMFVAPGSLGLYKIEVLIEDNFGGNTTSYIYVSNRAYTLNINSTYTDNLPIQSIVYLYSILNYADSYVSYIYTDVSTGLGSFNVFDGEYTVVGVKDNNYSFKIFVNGSDIQINLTWSSILVDVKTYNNENYATTVRLYNQGSTNQITSKTSNNGQTTFIVIPGIYDLRSDSRATYLYKYNLTSIANQIVNHEFAFGQIDVYTQYAYNNPVSLVTYLYEGITNTYLSYAYTGTDGYFTYNLAPGNYTLQIASIPVDYWYNMIVTSYGKVITNTTTGVLAIYTNNGTDKFDYYTQIYLQGSGTQIAAGGTGLDGVILHQLLPGIYDVKVDTIWYYNITIIEGMRTIMGDKTNSNPTIDTVSSSLGKLINSQTSEITVKVSDIDYDYGNLYATIIVNTGSINGVNTFKKFVLSNIFEFKFNYTSPSVLQTMLINITIFDESGGFDNFNYYISNQVNTVYLHSSKGDNLPEQTSLTFYDHQTGDYYTGGSTSSSGLITFNNIQDGWYDVIFNEFTNIRINNLLITGGSTFNLTAVFGELTVTSVGVGGTPLQSIVYVYNGTTDAYIGYRYTSSVTGIANFILAPGYYKIVVVEATNIEFFVLIEGGGIAIVGAGIPELISDPGDTIITEGSTGNVLSWVFTDTNPSTYNVTLNGTNYSSGVWTGASIDINVDGLPYGYYLVRIYVNDTYGLFNSHSILLTITQPDIGSLTHPVDQALTNEDNVSFTWQFTSTQSGTYIVYKNGVNFLSGSWSNNTDFSINDNPLNVGTYNYTIIITDTYNRIITDEVIITVTLPTQAIITSPPDQSIISGENATISWDVTSVISGTYTIYRNGLNIQEGSWSNSDVMGLNDGPVAVGTYNYTIIITDSYGRYNSDEVIITVILPTQAIITSPPDQSIISGENATISWDVTSVISGTYTIYRNGLNIQEGSWSNSDVIGLNDGPMAVGTYNYTLIITDSYGRYNSDEVRITVSIPMTAILSDPTDQTLVLGENVTISWDVTSVISGTYIIYKDGATIKNGEWTGNTIITVTDISPIAGNHNYTIVTVDSFGREISDTAIVVITEVQVESMEITLKPSDIVQGSTSSKNILVWVTTGSHEDNYEIFVNGASVKTGNWVSGQQLEFNYSSILDIIGTHEIKIVFQNTESDTINDIVFVTIVDNVGSSGSSDSPGFGFWSIISLFAFIMVRRISNENKRRKN